MATIKKNTIRGFTLIELLVVISIIGMLASVVLVALQGARQKGITAAGLEFAATNYHSQGATALGVWDFNDATAIGWSSTKNVAPSGNSYSLVPSSGSFARNAITPSGSGYSLALTSGGGIGVASFPDRTIVNATLSMWFYFTSLPAPSTPLFTLHMTSGGEVYQIFYSSGGAFQCDGSDVMNAGNHLTAILSVNPKVNTWYQVTCSINATVTSPNMINGYVNGVLAGSATGAAASDVSDPVGTVTVGAVLGNTAQFSGYVDDAAVYLNALQ